MLIVVLQHLCDYFQKVRLLSHWALTLNFFLYFQVIHMGEEVFIQHLYWVAGGVKRQLEGDRIY